MQGEQKHYALAWYQALKSANTKDRQEISDNMLSLLQMQGKLSWLSTIVDLVQKLEDEDLGITEVKVKIAHNKSKKEIEEIVTGLLGVKNIRANITVDPELLGGLIAQTKNRRWNISLRRKIEQLKKTLA